MPHRSVLAIAAWLIFCTVLLTLPGSSLPNKQWMGDFSLDKWIHIFLFGMMAWLACWAVYKTNRKAGKMPRYFMIAGLLCIIYGIGMEYVQKYCVPNRSFDTGDILADAAGSIAGTIFSLRRYLKK